MSHPGSYELATEFFVDTDAYSDRDRDMFAAGFEYANVVNILRHSDYKRVLRIRPENESRVRMIATKLGRRVKTSDVDTEGTGTLWIGVTVLTIYPRDYPKGKPS